MLGIYYACVGSPAGEPEKPTVPVDGSVVLTAWAGEQPSETVRNLLRRAGVIGHTALQQTK